jgi:hypothetical protein
MVVPSTERVGVEVYASLLSSSKFNMLMNALVIVFHVSLRSEAYGFIYLF